MLLLLSLGTLELLLRLMMGNWATLHLRQYQPTDGRCMGLEPGASVMYTGWLLRIPEVEQSINSLGYRGPARALEKPPDTLRILLVGDSYTFGVGRPEHETIAAELEGVLEGAVPQRVEVLNFGVPGLNIEEAFEQYSRFASRWEHDLVLYLLFSNDLNDPVCDEAAGFRRAASTFLENIYLVRAVVIPIRLVAGLIPGESDDGRLGAAFTRWDRAARDNGAQLRSVILGNPIRGDERDARFEAWMEASEIPLVDLSDMWLDRENLIPREFHFNAGATRVIADRIAGWLQEAPEGTRPEDS